MPTALHTVPKPVLPGAEMAALRRFHRDTTWTGRIAEGGMGPGTPEMTARGSGRHRLIQDGRWIVGDYRQEQNLLDGTPVLTWQLHWVSGWDPALREYRATVADCYGHAEVLRGRIDGDRLVFESTGEPPVRIRLTWELTGADTITWRNETSVDGGPWSLVEEYRCTPTPEPVPRERRPPLAEAVRTVNRYALNPLMVHLAGRRHWYAARLEHVGRRSGHPYATPLVAHRVPGGFAVPLPYGSGVDWLRNLMAAGRAELTVKGVAYTVTAPRTVPSVELAGSLAPLTRRLLRRIPEWVVVTAVPATAAERAG